MYLSNRAFNKLIQPVLPPTAAGSYFAHSFRIGGATIAAKHGYPKYFIQNIGCGRSASCKKHIKFDILAYINLLKALRYQKYCCLTKAANINSVYQ